MAGIKLTKREVGALTSRATTYIVFDRELPGFGVRVTPNGIKSWVVEYRANGGGRRAPTRRYTIGSTAIFSADDARNTAKDILAGVRLGSDPAETRKLDRTAATVEELSNEFLNEDTRVDRKDSTAQLYATYFRKHINPEIGAKRAHDVAHDDIIWLHRKIGSALPATANRVVQCLSGFYRWAIITKKTRRADNPARNVDLFVEKSRERFLSNDELGRLGDALREAETVGLLYEVDEAGPKAHHAPKAENRRTIIDRHAAAAIRLLLFTGARLREILHLRWDEVDLQRGFISLGDSKTGQKTIVLNAPAMQVLANLQRVGSLVIASRSSGTNTETPRADLHRPWRAITRRANLDGLRLHDLRHTHASVGAAAGVGLPVIGKILGHKKSETTERYAHLADDPLRRASERIGGDLSTAMGDRAPPRNIKRLRRVSST